ncbi:MAG: response regulator [Desulfovibrionales bacterium]|nr:response regulator [Desulfovibrionales bacterium]
MDALRVLLVDDEELYLQTVAKIFHRKGIDAVLCTNSLEAASILRETQCQVVVLDLKMPGMTGQDVLREIKAERPQVQVIILTGHATTEDAALCLTSGAFDFLLKPVDINDLIGKINAAFGVWKIVCNTAS